MSASRTLTSGSDVVTSEHFVEIGAGDRENHSRFFPWNQWEANVFPWRSLVTRPEGGMTLSAFQVCGDEPQDETVNTGTLFLGRVLPDDGPEPRASVPL